MRKTGIIVFILFLAALLLLTACGGQEAQAPAPEAAPAQAAAAEAPKEEKSPFPPVDAAIVAPDEAFVGVWLSVNTDDKLTVNADGTVLFNDLPAYVSEATDEDVFLRLIEWTEKADGDQASFTGISGKSDRSDLGWLHYDAKGFLYPWENGTDLFPFTYYYREGTESPAKKFYGTWTRCAGYGSTSWNGSLVETFVITTDNKIQINGDELDISYHLLNNGEWSVEAQEGQEVRIHLDMYDDTKGAYRLYIDHLSYGFEYYCKDVRSVELTLDNWREYFDVVTTYSTRCDEGGNVKYVMNRAFLTPKENFGFCGILNGWVAFTASPTAFAMIEYDVKANTYTIRDMTARERETYNSQFFKDKINYASAGSLGQYLKWSTDTETFASWGISLYEYAEDRFTLNGNIALVPTTIAADVDVTRIMGTIYYRDK